MERKAGAENGAADMTPSLANGMGAADELSHMAEKTVREAEQLSIAADGLFEDASEVVVCDEESNRAASEMLARAADLGKRFEALRKRFSVPLTKWKKAVDAYFKEKTEAVELADAHLRKGMLAYFKMQEMARQSEDRRRAQEHADATKQAAAVLEDAPALPEAAPEVEKTTRTDLGTTTIPMRWEWRLVDQSKVPEKYKVLDTVAINKAVREGERSIPGIVIEQMPYVVQR